MAAADDNKKQLDKSFVSEQQNWEQRVNSELESAKKWNENWGVLFSRGIPNDYEARIKYLEEELKKYDIFLFSSLLSSQFFCRQKTASVGQISRSPYGLGDGLGFKEVARVDARRKKMTDII
jgi:hypothetical protein